MRRITPADIPIAIPPGETVAAELRARDQTLEELAHSANLSLGHVKEIVSGSGSITPEVAAKLASFFGGSAGFWERLEAQYREAIAGNKPTDSATRDQSGNISLRIPKSLHRRIVRLAAAEGVSMNHCLLAIVAEGVAKHEMQSLPSPPTS